jgi:Protein of unknown function DUF262
MGTPEEESLADDEADRGEENETDLVGLDSPETLEAVVASTDWTAETILNQIRRGNIQLDPEFQRRDAWNRTRKSRFIESLIVGIPVPQIVLARRKEVRGSYLVLDGKQRLLTMSQFAAEADDLDATPLRLTQMQLRPDLNGLTYDRLPPADRNEFDNQTIRTVVVRNWANDNFLFAVFLRLNTGNLPLSPQELRQALHTGNLKPFLDYTCETLNEQWQTHEEEIRAAAERCELAIQTTLDVFEDVAFRRWNFDRYERPFNRAVFDIMTFYFKDRAIAGVSRDNAAAVGEAFRAACDDPLFNGRSCCFRG